MTGPAVLGEVEGGGMRQAVERGARRAAAGRNDFNSLGPTSGVRATKAIAAGLLTAHWARASLLRQCRQSRHVPRRARPGVDSGVGSRH